KSHNLSGLWLSSFLALPRPAGRKLCALAGGNGDPQNGTGVVVGYHIPATTTPPRGDVFSLPLLTLQKADTVATTLECPNCFARLRVPEERLGSRLACPRCHAAINTQPPPDEDFEVVDDDADERAERPSRDPDRPRKKKRKKKKPESNNLKW